jgi:hypothetical protein
MTIIKFRVFPVIKVVLRQGTRERISKFSFFTTDGAAPLLSTQVEYFRVGVRVLQAPPEYSST